MAHAAMLGKQEIIENGETEKIIEGLKGILSDLESGKLQFSEEVVSNKL
jgi:argininosuccinate lyase